jgi:hypothetical protein
MRKSLLVLAALAISLLQGSSCIPGTGITVVQPAANVDVTTPSFTVEIQLAPGTFDTGTLVATINGIEVLLAGGPTVFTATVNPGAPLLDANVLEVEVETLGGASRAVVRPFLYAPPKARVRQISDPADLLTGPLAQGRIGDWLLVNDVARFVVQDVAKRDLHGVGTFGGNLIDAALVGQDGLENFGEIQPSVNIETVINAQTVEVVNDGQDGTPAILRTCGPDDLIDYINPSSVVADAGGNFPSGVDDQDYEVEGCTEYKLAPGKRYVEMATTIQNSSGDDLDLFVGDYLNGMGELEQWTSPVATNRKIGIGEALVTYGNLFFSYIGFGEGTGVDYALVSPQPPSVPAPSSSFTQSKVSFVLHGHSIPLVLFFGNPANFSVPDGGSATFTRHFAVGDGSGSNAVAVQAELQGIAAGTLQGCVTIGGAPAPNARVTAGILQSGAIGVVRGNWVTDGTGCYSGTIATGTYQVAAARDGVPYEGGGTTPLLHPVTITNGGTVTQDIALPATGRLHVDVVDETSAPVPARISVVGFDPSPPSAIVGGFLSPNDTRTGTFQDVGDDPLAFGLTRVAYAGASGSVEFDLEPGSYQVFVSRGSEYSAFDAPVTITASNTSTVAAQIARVIDTTGFVSSDYHVHQIDSPDSNISWTNRVMQFAGEGVDNIIATDHDAHTDLNPHIASLGLTPFVHSTIGEEITSFDYGHFNAYPLGLDPTQPSRGSTDHGGAAPPGDDFPAYGQYNLSPAQIHAAVLTDPINTSPEVAVQINHIGSHFSPLKIDSALIPPQSLLTPAEQLGFRLDPSITNLYHHFPALELWNGHNRAHQSEFLDDRIGIWMNLLNQGLVTTAIADTDTHEFNNVRGGGARTWTAASSDPPAAIDDDEIGASVKAGRAVGGQGLYVQARLLATDGPGVADLTLGGSKLVSVSNNEVEIEISVQAPLWAPYDRIEIYANASTVVTGTNGGVPVQYSATPTLLLTSPGFPITTVNDFPSIPGAQHRETTHTVTLSGLTEDTWVVVVVKGTDGVSQPMFPIMPASLASAGNTTLADLLDGNLGQSGMMALGFTNALYVDVDGNSTFDAPLP